MGSTLTKSPEAMDTAELLTELEAGAAVRGNEREMRLLRALKIKINLLSTLRDTPMGWAEYGQGPRGLDAVKE